MINFLDFVELSFLMLFFFKKKIETKKTHLQFGNIFCDQFVFSIQVKKEANKQTTKK